MEARACVEAGRGDSDDEEDKRQGGGNEKEGGSHKNGTMTHFSLSFLILLLGHPVEDLR